LAGEDNLFKIGKTKRTVKKRLKEQNNGRIIVLDLELRTECCDFAEKYLHTRLAQQRVYRYDLQGRKKQIEWFQCNLATIQKMSKELPAHYMCPDLERAFGALVHGLDHPECYSDPFPRRRMLLVASQPEIDKGAMIAMLLNTRPDLPVYLLSIPETAPETCTLIHGITIPIETKVLLITNAHHLLYQSKECADVRFFALNLRRYANLSVIALSDEPYGRNPFYDQFELKVAVSLPTMDHLRELYQCYFSWIPDHQLTEDDLEWLIRCSDWCTPRDVYEFCAKVFYRCCCETKIPVTRELLEAPHNKFISDHQHPGIWSISDEDTRTRQMPYDVASGRGFVPKKRPHED
jgi:hypothetical protein